MMSTKVEDMTKNLEQMSQHLLQVFIKDSMKGKDASDVERANRHLRKAYKILKTYNDEQRT